MNNEITQILSKNINDINCLWKPSLNGWEKHLDVEKFIIDCVDLGVNCEYWCVENDGITQGIILLITSECYSKIDSELPIININYIGVAPWNRKKNKAIGTKLCRFAISRCIELKYGGIGAYAVYDSEGFFRKIGFNYVEHQTYQGLMYMEYVKSSESTQNNPSKKTASGWIYGMD